MAGYRQFARENHLRKPKYEVMQFANWGEWKEYERWNARHNVSLLYVSHKSDSVSGKVFIKFEIV